MSFCSFIFILLFLPIILFLYYIVKNRVYRNTLLLLASLFFYTWGEPKYIGLLIFSILINYIIAILIEKANHKKIILLIGVIINISLLFIFKYLNFMISTMNTIFNIDVHIKELALPIGISFYTFQILSYLIDVYKNRAQAEKNIFDLALYISFFPQLVAGPIVKYNKIKDQIRNRKESIIKFYNGIKRFMIGFSKKIIIANHMAIICDTIYGYNISSLSMPILWLAALAFSFQIYFDFSGYSDMAIGLASMFGLEIPENFNYPYLATSITDFWRRWHISLTTWFREYVYIPMGGNRCSKIKWIRNIVFVFLLTGIWHGANYNYIIWGLYYALFLILEKFILGKFRVSIPKIIRWFLTMVIVTVGWVIFRIQDINILIIILRKMFDFSNLKFLVWYYSNYEMVLSSLYLPLALVCSFPIFTRIKKMYDNHIGIEIGSFFLIFISYSYSLLLLLDQTKNIFLYFKF